MLMIWAAMLLVVVASSIGDTVLARGMKRMGDLDALRRARGFGAVTFRVITAPLFLIGLACHAVAFFALMTAMSWADLSLVAPATASLTFVGTTITAKVFLGERVDRRRWFATVCVCAGVFLLTL